MGKDERLDQSAVGGDATTQATGHAEGGTKTHQGQGAGNGTGCGDVFLGEFLGNVVESGAPARREAGGNVYHINVAAETLRTDAGSVVRNRESSHPC